MNYLYILPLLSHLLKPQRFISKLNFSHFCSSGARSIANVDQKNDKNTRRKISHFDNLFFFIKLNNNV